MSTDTRNDGGPAYKAGDMVRVIANLAPEHPHGFEIGTVLPVLDVYDDGSGLNLGEWACRLDEVELAARSSKEA